MRIFVTGANGFTGRHFTDIARIHGHEIIKLKTDLLDSQGVKEELDRAKADSVLHLAAIAFVGQSNIKTFYEVNVLGTINLLEALLSVNKYPDSVVLASSANIYGNVNSSKITELQPPAPVNHYSMSKLAMEYMALTYLDRLPIIFTRPFNYTGRGQSDSFIIPKLISHFSQKSDFIELGNIDVKREFNDVRVICDAYLSLLKKGVSGEIYNICSGDPISLREVIIILENITGHSLKININSELIRTSEVKNISGDSTKIESQIGNLKHIGLVQTLNWMLSE